MNDEISPTPVPRNQLREEAANWFAICAGLMAKRAAMISIAGWRGRAASQRLQQRC
jgi:hypothetical protein